MRVAALAMVVLSCAASALAGFNVNVTKAPGFDPASISKVVVVTFECHEALDCRRLEREVATELQKAQLRLRVMVGDPVYSQLLGMGKERYSVDLREQLSAALGADTVLELSAPHASPGMGTRKRSEVKLTLRLVRPTGEILFVGDGSGRPTNTISSPEKAAGEVAERVFEEVFRP